jgi:ABC-2 type transport system ATP-binding protein
MIIDVTTLKKNYKNQEVLKGIDIQVETPQILALVGPNGAGKTTLMNCMMNLLPFNEGHVTLLGKKHTDSSIFYDVSYMQDNRILYGDLTAHDHLAFICDIQKLPKSRILSVAERVGMASYLKIRVRKFSLGMKQHLLLAMAIINEPKILLMDEPINGLDPTSAINMRNILLELHAEGTTILISSHNLDEIDRLTNTIYFMKNGTLLKESIEDFATNQYILSVDKPEQARLALTGRGLSYQMTDNHKLTFEEINQSLHTVLETLYKHQIQVLEIQNERVGAERRYLELFESEQT